MKFRTEIGKYVKFQWILWPVIPIPWKQNRPILQRIDTFVYPSTISLWEVFLIYDSKSKVFRNSIFIDIWCGGDVMNFLNMNLHVGTCHIYINWMGHKSCYNQSKENWYVFSCKYWVIYWPGVLERVKFLPQQASESFQECVLPVLFFATHRVWMGKKGR